MSTFESITTVLPKQPECYPIIRHVLGNLRSSLASSDVPKISCLVAKQRIFSNGFTCSQNDIISDYMQMFIWKFLIINRRFVSKYVTKRKVTLSMRILVYSINNNRCLSYDIYLRGGYFWKAEFSSSWRPIKFLPIQYFDFMLCIAVA